MKRFFLGLGLGTILLPTIALAQMSYLDEVRALGAVSGQGLACGASKYDSFELLARAILISKAPSDSFQTQGMYAYNEEKANAYISKQMDGMYNCAEINRRFDNQEIFNATLYADGTIKMPDGKIITPRQPYDASVIYKKDDEQKIRAQAIYDKGDNVKVGEVKLKTDDGHEVITRQKEQTTETAPEIPAETENSIGHIKSKW